MLKGEVTPKFSVFRMPNTTRNLKTLHDKPRQTRSTGQGPEGAWHWGWIRSCFTHSVLSVNSEYAGRGKVGGEGGKCCQGKKVGKVLV